MSQLSRQESTAVARSPNDRMQRMKGMKIRDEFICPITYELMVNANTYVCNLELILLLPTELLSCQIARTCRSK